MYLRGGRDKVKMLHGVDCHMTLRHQHNTNWEDVIDELLDLAEDMDLQGHWTVDYSPKPNIVFVSLNDQEDFAKMALVL